MANSVRDVFATGGLVCAPALVKLGHELDQTRQSLVCAGALVAGAPVAVADPGLSSSGFAPARAALPVRADLFRLRAGGHRCAWTILRQLAGAAPAAALPSAQRRRF